MEIVQQQTWLACLICWYLKVCKKIADTPFGDSARRNPVGCFRIFDESLDYLAKRVEPLVDPQFDIFDRAGRPWWGNFFPMATPEGISMAPKSAY